MKNTRIFFLIFRKMRCVALFLALIFCWQLQSIAQEAEKKTQNQDILQQIKFDTKYIIDTPKRMDAKDYLALASGLGLLGLMYADKDDINKHFQKNRTNTTDDIAKIVRPFGDKFVVPGIAAAFYSWGALEKSPRQKETGLMLAESFIYTAIVTAAGQFIFAEDRPYEGGDMHFFELGGHGISGHAALSASLIGPIDRQYLKIEPDATETERMAKRIGKLSVYGLPILTALSRVNDNEHYLWNVISGGILGYSIGELVVNAHRKSNKSNLEVMPFIRDECRGVRLAIRF